MKRVSDSISFKSFSDSCKESLGSYLQELVRNNLPKAKIEKIKKLKVYMLISFCSAPVLLVLSLLFMSFNLMHIGWSLVFLTFIVFLIGYLFFRQKTKTTKEIASIIKRTIPKDEIYHSLFKQLNEKWEYVGSDLSKIGALYSPDFVQQAFSVNEINKNKPSSIPYAAHLYSRESVNAVLLDQKYPLYYQNIVWRQIIERYDSRGNRFVEYRFFNSCLIRIDASLLDEEKRASFSLFESGFFTKKDRINLENDQFNKVFKLHSNDELRMRTYFTVLAQEVLTETYHQNINYTACRSIHTYVNDWLITYNFQTKPGFMQIDTPQNTIKEDLIINHIFWDIMKDVYTFYFLVQLIYIPVYLY
ncbi:hypothetical protein [Mycoplasma sp. Ms02]|uniref:hypothetical protein n=1 Tax=Mycoplasma sp. Ms02 TaxID=353851 RepID=UPI001C89930A|nr:hypothetical protein [Mycoplasma sp. Ms02]QZE12417.1 hypothetical protein K4L35_00275 [Mycoplasma sp. Ms02]